MRLGGRTAAAIAVLADLESRYRPASEALKDWGTSHRFAGSGDRAAIGNLVYDTLRKKASQGWAMRDDSPRALVVATLLSQWGYDSTELAANFAGDRHAPNPPSDDEIGAWSSRDPEAAPDHVRANVPEWCAPLLEAGLGKGWVGEGEALAKRPPLDLRVNRLKATPEKALSALARLSPLPCRLSPLGIRFSPGRRGQRLPNITAEQSYRRGWVEIQDEGSQIAAFAAQVNPGEQVLDLCAGGGGKTLALAAAMENRGQVHAYDADRNRLAPIFERLRRAGTRNVQVHEPEADLASLSERMDCVFVDAPCSGSGTWRRRPDGKWRADPSSVDQRIAEQRAIVRRAAGFVRPGGRLIYVTCSLFPQENAGIVDEFLAAHPEFSADHELDVHDVDSTLVKFDPSGGDLTLSPARTDTDGFYVARLRRSGL